MHYLVCIGYESDVLDRAGEPRIQKVNYVIESDSTEEATILAAKYRGESTQGSKTISIKEIKIECVIDPKNTPQYYSK